MIKDRICQFQNMLFVVSTFFVVFLLNFIIYLFQFNDALIINGFVGIKNHIIPEQTQLFIDGLQLIRIKY